MVCSAPVDWLNYHHLYYFWMVAREGSVTAAAAALRLSQSTISGQLKQLEESLGEKLLRRAGRNLELTEMGKVTFRHADEIFEIGRSLQDVIAGRKDDRVERLVIGVSDLMPKLILHRLLQPALGTAGLRVVCREDKTERLLGMLAVHDVDLVLAESPIAGQASVRAFNHPLGESKVNFYGTKALAKKLRKGFPQSLDGAPVLLPTDNTLLRRALEKWFVDESVRPHVIAEFEDSALMKAFGGEGAGAFPSPASIADEITKTYNVEMIGQVDSVVERFYAITVERRLVHPAVREICDNARERIFIKQS